MSQKTKKIDILEAKKFFSEVFCFSEGDPEIITISGEEVYLNKPLDEEILRKAKSTSLISYFDNGAELWGIFFEGSDSRAAMLVEAGYTPSFELYSQNDPTIKVWLFDHPLLEGSGKLPDNMPMNLPIPGVGGWASTIDGEIVRHPLRLLDALNRVVPKAAPAVSGTVTSSVLRAAPKKLNDALVYGEIPEEVLNKPVSFSYSPRGKETAPGKWKTFENTFGEALNRMFSLHPVGEKNGFSFLQGNALNGVRTKQAIEKMSFVVLDLDTGESIENIKMRIAENGYFAVIYTTHSHMKDTTTIKRDAILKYFNIKENPDISKVKRYLQEVRGYQNQVVENLSIESYSQHNAEGVVMVIKHNPMQKFRVMFLLDKPYIFSERNGLHKEAMDEWGERYAGVSKKIGAFFDISCADPSRLFFTPRHSNNSPYEIYIISGKPIDIDSFDKVPKKEWKQEATIWEKAADSVDTDEYRQYKTDNILMFAKKYGNSFEFEDFIRDVDPDGDRGRRSNGPGSTWRCPNDDAHSNPGDENDKGFFCYNASESESGGGFFGHCMHMACAEIDRLGFLDILCQEHGIKNALELKKYVTDVEEETEEEESSEEGSDEKEEEITAFKSKKEAEKIISTVTEQTDKSEVALIARRLGISKIGRIDKTSLMKTLSKLSKVSLVDIKAEAKEAANSDPKEKDLDDDLANALSKYNETYGVILVGGKARVIKQPSAANASPILMDMDSFKIAHAPDKYYMPDANGVIKPQPVAKMWLEWEGRRFFPNGIVFEPKKEVVGAYNLWKGLPIKGRAGNWNLLQEHIHNNICRRDEEWYNWLITWMAQIIQHPGEKMGSAVAIKGKKGVGKSKMFEWLMHLLGPYAIKVAHRQHITGNFNAHQKGSVLMVCEEAFWAGDMEAGGVLKDMMLEQKGFDPVPVSNHLRLAMISNEDWVAPASFDDERRFFVLECGNARQRDIEFFKALDAQMLNGGAEAFMHYLDTWKPLTSLGWDILRVPPKTPWLAKQAEESLDSLGKFLLLVAEEGAFPEVPGQMETLHLNEEEETFLSVNDIRANLSYHLRSNRSAGYKIYNRDGLRKSLIEILSMRDGMRKIGPKGNQVYHYVFPPLKEIKTNLAKRGINAEVETYEE